MNQTLTVIHASSRIQVGTRGVRTGRFVMLVLSRKKSEVIIVGGLSHQDASIEIVVLEIGNGFVKLGIKAPASVPVHRMEVWERIQTDESVAKSS